MPRTQEQNQAIQEASKNNILEAAIMLFAEHGYDGTSIRQIAERAGVARGLLYNYFDGKEALLVEIMNRGMAYANKAFEDIPPSAPPLQQLETLVQQIFVELQNQQDFWRVFYSLRNLPAFEAVLGQEIIESTLALKDVFHALYEAGGIDNPELRARVLYAMVEGIIQQYLLFGGDYPLQEVVNEAVHLHITKDRTP
jgi:AcrR family transcriptional regulator